MTAGAEFDLVVVGGGGAGLASAASAAQEGASVALFEKEAACGGNTARSIGSIPGAGSRLQQDAGVVDSPDRFVADVATHTGGAFNREGLARLAGVSAELVHWLIDVVGIPLRLTEDYRHVGHAVTRLHNPPGREGAVLVEALRAFAGEQGASIRTGTPVTAVTREGGRFQVAAGGEHVNARSVVLAADGFGANPEMMREEAGRYAALSYFGGPGNTGDGIRIGRALGGQTGSMSSVLGFAIMGLPTESPSSWETMVSWTVIENGGVVVDGRGRRFGDESRGYSSFVDDVIDGGGPPVYAVFDQRILDSVAKWEDRFRLLVDRADSPVRLLDLQAPPFGLDPSTVERTLDEYRSAAEGIRPDPFGRTDFGWAPLGGPLYAARSEPAVLTTLGGLVVGPDGEVLDHQGRPVPGLFAAGGTAQSLVGDAGARGYISGAGLLAALGYGYLAGRAAARRPASS
jgi:fumarate reductase flavoprotein subunit